jgi:hypothetical protein
MHFHEGEPIDDAHGWITITIGFGPDSSIGGSAVNPLDVAKHQAYPLLEKRISKYLLDCDALKDLSSCQVGLAVSNKKDEGLKHPILTLLVSVTSTNSSVVYYALTTNKQDIEGKSVPNLKKFPPERTDLHNLEQNGQNVLGITNLKSKIRSYTIWGNEQPHLSDALDTMFDNLQHLLNLAARPKTTCHSIITAMLPKTDTDSFFDIQAHTVFDIIS